MLTEEYKELLQFESLYKATFLTVLPSYPCSQNICVVFRLKDQEQHIKELECKKPKLDKGKYFCNVLKSFYVAILSFIAIYMSDQFNAV